MRHQIAMRAVDVNAGEAGLFDDTRRCRELSDRVLDLVIGHRSSPEPRFVTGVDTSVPCHGVPIASLEYYGRRRVRRFLALARVVFFVPELARVVRRKATSVFAAGSVFLADILPFCALDCWGCFGKAGFGVWGVSAISSPNRAATSLSSSTFAAPGAVVSGESCPALASISVSSTSRSTKRS